jgi:hypothetical protein
MSGAQVAQADEEEKHAFWEDEPASALAYGVWRLQMCWPGDKMSYGPDCFQKKEACQNRKQPIQS